MLPCLASCRGLRRGMHGAAGGAAGRRCLRAAQGCWGRMQPRKPAGPRRALTPPCCPPYSPRLPPAPPGALHRGAGGQDRGQVRVLRRDVRVWRGGGAGRGQRQLGGGRRRRSSAPAPRLMPAGHVLRRSHHCTSPSFVPRSPFRRSPLLCSDASQHTPCSSVLLSLPPLTAHLPERPRPARSPPSALMHHFMPSLCTPTWRGAPPGQASVTTVLVHLQ